MTSRLARPSPASSSQPAYKRRRHPTQSQLAQCNDAHSSWRTCHATRRPARQNLPLYASALPPQGCTFVSGMIYRAGLIVVLGCHWQTHHFVPCDDIAISSCTGRVTARRQLRRGYGVHSERGECLRVACGARASPQRQNFRGIKQREHTPVEQPRHDGADGLEELGGDPQQCVQ